jgi:hypothetical protein
MFSQPAPSSSAGPFGGKATVHPLWLMPNPDVDRAAPPRPVRKKSAKKKPATKKPAKKR